MEKLNKCVECGGTSLRTGTALHSATVSGMTFAVELPAEVCDACSEAYMAGSDIERAELAIAADLARKGARSGDAFRYMRKALGLRANALAELFDLQPETVTRWEKGTQNLDPRAFALLGSLVIDKMEGRGDAAFARLRALKEPAKVAAAPVRVELPKAG